MMKKHSLLYLPVLAMMATACSEENIDGPVADVTGKEVVFAFTEQPQSRTMYGSDINDPLSNDLYWGNYSTVAGADEIKIFSQQCVAGRNIATYTVKPANVNSNKAASITKKGEYGLQWGAPDADYKFYAFYPASRCGDQLTGGNTITAEVRSGQSPVSYYTTTWDPTSTVAFAYEKTPGAQTTYIGNPDMKCAVMFAKNEGGKALYDQPVDLNFNVLADVLDITINGPQYNNLLNGGEAPEEYIEIQRVEVVSGASADATTGDVIAGTFSLNMNQGTVSGKSGSNTISIVPSQIQNGATRFARLYRHSGNGNYDKLKVRAFLIPGANVANIWIKVTTNRGTYSRNLKDADNGGFSTGKIHRVKLPHFVYPGQAFDFSKWISQLDPNIYVNELSIPGSWHSNNSSYQPTSIAEQYKFGIRAFEFHVYSKPYSAGTGTSGQEEYRGYLENNSNSTRLSAVITEIYKTMNNSEFVVIEIGCPGDNEYFAQAVTNELNAVKNYLYTEQITPGTTIKDVAGKIIIKINTNGSNATDVSDTLGTNEKGWAANTPALFSRWLSTSATTPQNIALAWGQPIAPDNQDATMRWVFTEVDNITDQGGGIENRKLSIAALGAMSYEAYKKGEHNTWYECAIGGFLNGEQTKANCLAASQALNPYTLDILSNPTREASPFGLVYMGYACTEVQGATNCRSEDLVRQIIYNNNAFVLNRAGGIPSPQSSPDTASKFTPGGSVTK